MENINSTNITFKNACVRDVKAKSNVTIINPCNLYECELNENVFIGPFCEIQKDVKIGANTRIQSHSFICSLVNIGANCFIGHGVMFINDDFKNARLSNENEWRETIIEDNVLIGSNATILPVKIVSGTIIGAGAVVTKDILQKGFYAGNPARKIQDC